MGQELSPGMALPSQEQLAREYQVSRPVIREAIRILEGKELITGNQGKISHVAHPQPRIVERFFTLYLHQNQRSWIDLMNVRRVLEIESARIAALHIDQEDVRRLEVLLQQMDDSRQVHTQYNMLDVQFHVTIAGIGNNDFLLHLIETACLALMQLITELQIVLPSDSYDVFQANHLAIYRALREKNEDSAATAMTNHFHEIIERIAAEISG